ncbi:MAG: hypothetical protein AVDCRST_MAG30-2574 [uncultured Solirubrobacteraceae bacterium]|uniref:Uncharacterized protein n=1 Tax=uncultured Solirubrobacteraceae bacterium TaxID=1162706 RepID=A0A6J4T434_9ACTN|nr:MAG: hypothetical protein AVDCRST_MAG30-2574 [uncultured Solirubrobacteraceae bacterium]
MVGGVTSAAAVLRDGPRDTVKAMMKARDARAGDGRRGLRAVAGAAGHVRRGAVRMVPGARAGSLTGAGRGGR